MYDRHSINRELFLRNNKQVNDKIFEYLDENNPLERKHLEDELNPIESRIAEYYKGFYEGIRQMLEKEGIHWEDRGHYVYHAYVDSRYDVPWWEIDPKFRLGQPSKPRDFPKAEEVLRKWPHLKLYADGNLEAIARLYAYRAFLSLGRSKALEYLRKAGMAKIAEEKTASEFDVTMYPNEVRSPIGQRYFLTNDGLELYNRAFMAPQMSPVASQFIRGLWGIKRVSMPISFSLGAMAHGFHMAYSTFMYESRGVHWMKALSNLFTTELRKKAPGVVDYFYGRKKLEDLNQWERSIVGHLEDAGIPVTHRESVLQELGEFAGPLTRERFEQIYGKTFGKLYEQLDRLGFFKLQNFVFSEMVPLYKIQWALNRIEEMYRREPHLHKELPEYWDRMAKIRDMALDWFGEASWDIHAKAWDPVLSRSLGAMMVSLPWQIGFFRRVGRQAGYLWKLAHGERLNWLETQEFLGNLVYAITLPTIIAGINYYNTGELPKKLEDFLDIKTTKNEDGSWNAISPITYHKELFHIRNIGRYPSLWSLWESFSSKVTPFWRSVIELATNRDFLGHPVYPEDWTVDQRKRIEAAWLAIEHVLESATPLPIENLIHRVREGREASPWEAVSGVLGFRPTRITIYDSPVYEEVSKLWSAYGIKSHSFEAGEHARAIRELIQARDRGDTLTATRIVAEHPDLAKEFEGPNQEKRVHRMFRELPPEWQRYILKKYGFTPEAQELMKLAPKWLRNEVMQETVPGEERVEEEAPTS
ncbi:hypothetical protein MPNT_670001 [Candidatus Methylacidithermus pantelleriae]|uniref:Uncharacterized protein n=2 Tax=Candidatus Methylacidithermus pantelleriae TaxID=2744239 RepID=A0A8J2BSG3_9BACT|nr:hypothetical protein MPNT_670001 [Candidatus Methylacidithermus pantelleriae]